MVLHIRLGQVGADDADDATRYIRYIDNPGQKLVKKVKFTVNGNPLDEYDDNVHNMHEKFFVGPNKQLGWDKNVGQEVAKTGYVDSGSGRGAGARQKVQICDGPQTPRATQPALDMWIPLLFWFNKDPRLSIPSVSIPYGQRFIDVTLAREREVLQHVGAAPYDDNPAANAPPVPNVEVCELYINNIFVNPEIHDIFIKRIGFSLIRVHRQQSTRTAKHMDRILHQQLKWPIETLYLGLRPVENINENSTKLLESWHMYSRTSTETFQACALANGFYLTGAPAGATGAQWQAVLATVTGIDLTGVAAPGGDTVDDLNDFLTANGIDKLYDPSDFADPLAPTVAELENLVPTVYCEASYLSCTEILEKITVEAHGIPLYRDIPAPFFNHYVPYTYGGQHVTTPEDCGVQMITFNLYPGSYQPSGHVNISRAREFYIEFTRTQQNGADDNSQADKTLSVRVCIKVHASVKFL